MRQSIFLNPKSIKKKKRIKKNNLNFHSFKKTGTAGSEKGNASHCLSSLCSEITKRELACKNCEKLIPRQWKKLKSQIKMSKKIRREMKNAASIRKLLDFSLIHARGACSGKRGNVSISVPFCALMEVMSYSIASHLLKFGGGSGNVVKGSKKSNVHLKIVCELCMNRQE